MNYVLYVLMFHLFSFTTKCQTDTHKMRWYHIDSKLELCSPFWASQIILNCNSVPFFLIFWDFDGIGAVGNTGMIVIIKLNPKLHTSWIFFLSHLSFVGFCYSSIIAFKMLLSLFARDRTISFSVCVAQYFFFAALL